MGRCALFTARRRTVAALLSTGCLSSYQNEIVLDLMSTRSRRISRGGSSWSSGERVELLSLVDISEPLSGWGELAARCPDIRLEKGEEFYRAEEHDGSCS